MDIPTQPHNLNIAQLGSSALEYWTRWDIDIRWDIDMCIKTVQNWTHDNISTDSILYALEQTFPIHQIINQHHH